MDKLTQNGDDETTMVVPSATEPTTWVAIFGEKGKAKLGFME